jgi:hypothetical protein
MPISRLKATQLIVNTFASFFIPWTVKLAAPGISYRFRLS